MILRVKGIYMVKGGLGQVKIHPIAFENCDKCRFIV